jgi:tRNA(fMet)-specific endonuclease VapC
MKKILIDTNAYSRLLSGDKDVLAYLSRAGTVFMSVFVIGELYSGFRGGKKEIENKSILKRFLEKPSVETLNATRDTAEIFALIKHELTQSGTPIPVNDVWIAAHALETGSLVITYDRHFLNIKGLRIWDEISEF